MAILTILTINIGSSSLKASLFTQNGRNNHQVNYDDSEGIKGLLKALKIIISKLDHKPDIVGHRIVHGGDCAELAKLIDQAEYNRLTSIRHLAPLHMDKSLQVIDELSTLWNVPQVACYDTAFHATLPKLAYQLPIPNRFGMRKYGFHGLNYAHIARQLPSLLGDTAKGNIIVAHLGSGASLCMLQNLKSIDTTMGFTPAGGIPMATRSGDLDPGVMLALAERLTPAELTKVTYHEMGLYALSNSISGNMATLLDDGSDHAKFAVQYFCDHVRASIGALAAKHGGLDALIFTGGIGEHAAQVRKQICERLDFLGIEIKQEANQTNISPIHKTDTIPVLIVEANEESEIMQLTSEVANTRLH